jgi:hypothetical protein
MNAFRTQTVELGHFYCFELPRFNRSASDMEWPCDQMESRNALCAAFDALRLGVLRNVPALVVFR